MANRTKYVTLLRLAACLAIVTFTAGGTAIAFAADLAADKADSEATPTLEGSASITVPGSFKGCVNGLIEQAEKQDDRTTLYDEAIAKYNTVGNRVAARTFDALNYTLMFKGISPSAEAADVVLGEKNKLKGLASAKYLRQKLHDELHVKVVANVLQLASALGNGDSAESARQLQQAEEELTKLVGKPATDNAISYLKALQEHEASQAKDTKPIWTLQQTQERIQAAVQAAATKDNLVKEIQDDVHHYNKHHSVTLASHRLTRVMLSAVSLAPSLVGPAAQAVMFGYLAVSGGTEQEKLLRELYLDKRLNSRAHVLAEEAHLAFENYQLSTLTKNKMLMQCSEELLTGMTDADTAQKLLAAGDLKALEAQEAK